MSNGDEAAPYGPNEDTGPIPVVEAAAVARKGMEPPEPPAEAEPVRTRHRGRRILLGVISAVLILLLAAGGILYQRQSAYDHNIKRIPGALPTGTSRPSPSVPRGTENWLLVGTDNRLQWSTAGQTWLPGHQQSDTMMLIQLASDHKTAYVISIPGNAWVNVPSHGQGKISTAFLDGGPPLLAETVEGLTGVRVDHFAALNFEGFETMTNALGGVHHLTGEQALLLVTQRSGLPNDEILRIQRQQGLLKALTAKAVSGGTILNPLKLNAFLEALSKSISVDSSVSGSRLRGLVLSLSGLRTGNIRFLTAPVTGTAKRAGQQVTLLDPNKLQALDNALRSGTMADYPAGN